MNENRRVNHDVTEIEKTIETLAAEQGVKPFRVEDYVPSKLWNTQEEFEEFLESINEKP